MTATLARRGLLDVAERRIDGDAKVSGEAAFAADFSLPGMLWAAFATSPLAHARIRSVDTTAASEMPGVRAVLTGVQIGEHRYGRRLFDRPVVAIDRVLFIGDVVAAVAAETREAAEAAAAAIAVDYEEIPAVFEPEEALAEGAPVLHDRPERYYFWGGTRSPVSHPNIQGRHVLNKGDLEGGFARASRIFEHEFNTPRYHGGYIEPRATVVWIDEDDVVHVIATNKSPFAFREGFAVCTGVPPERVRIEPAYIGGDFGGKGLSVDEYPCYFLARETKRPVKYVRTYIDDMRATTVRHASRTRLRTGVNADGRITAVDAKITFNGGAYAAGKPIPTLIPGLDPKLPYDIPAGRLERLSVYTNTVPGGHMRAPGDVQFMFAFESHLDMIAAELGIDPLELRRRNAVRGDGSDFDGIPYREPSADDVLQLLREHGRWGTPLPPGRGRGIALGTRHIGGGKAEIKLVLLPSGEIEAHTGALEQGMGVLTVVQRVIAATLEIDPDLVSIVHEAASQGAPYDPGAGGSRQTHVTGGAAMLAAQRLREKIAAAVPEWPERVDWVEAVRRAAGSKVVEVNATFEAAHGHDPEPHGFCGYVIEVSVDRETGAVTIHDALCVADVGTVVNPVAHRGQIAGGFAMGIGHALTEELRVRDGLVENASLADYKLPTQLDVPPLRFLPIVDRAGPGPFAAKMVGEINTATVAPALANAIAAACGARVTTLPLSAERILAAIHHSTGTQPGIAD